MAVALDARNYHNTLPSTCHLPKYSKYICLKELAIAKTFCQSYKKPTCPNNNPLCKILADLEKEKQGVITDICVPKSTSATMMPTPTETSADGCPATPANMASPNSCTKGNPDCGTIFAAGVIPFSQYFYGQKFITGDDFSGKDGFDTMTTTFDGSLAKCDAASQCAEFVNNNWFSSFDLHYNQAENTYDCVGYIGQPTCGAADFHYPDNDAVCVYGYAVVPQ
ncbi:hypothetical protein ACLMJK_003800 [Lecanora helva]